MKNIFNKIIKTCFYLLVFLLPLFWLPFTFEVFEFNKQYLLFFLVSVAFLAWLARMILEDKKIRFKKTLLDLFVLVFIFITILGAIFSVDKISSLVGFYGRFSNGLIGLLSLGVLYFLITNNVGIKIKDYESSKPSPKNVTRQAKLKEKGNYQNAISIISVEGILKAFLVSVFFVILFSYLSIFGLWQKITGMVEVELPQIMLQLIFNPVAGSLEGLAIFLAIVSVLLVGRISISQKRELFNYLLLILALILLIIIGFASAWLVLIISLVVFLALALGKRLFRENINRLLLPILLVIIAGIFISLPSSNIQNLFLNLQLPREQLLDFEQSWGIGLRSATDNLKSGLVGSGIGTWHYDFAKFKSAQFNQHLLWQIRFDRAGSYLAALLATTGFLGFLSYLILIGIFFLMSYFFLQKNGSQIPLLMMFSALFISQFVYYQNTVLAFTFWLILGLSVVSWQKPGEEKSLSFKKFPELSLLLSVFLIVLLIMILGIYFFAGKFYLADINFRENLAKANLQKIEKAVSLNPYQIQYRIALARNYLRQASTEMAKPIQQQDLGLLQKSMSKAVEQAKTATQISPNSVAGWETLGMIYSALQRRVNGALKWGVKSFEKAISLEPTNPVLHTELGKLYLALKDREKARAEFETAKELKPDYVPASLQIALLFEAENNLEQGIKEMESLANSYPFNIEIRFQLGRLYFNAQRMDEAITQFKQIINLMPNHSNALYSLAMAYQKKGQKEKAIATFEKVLELNPGNQDVIQKLQELRK